MIWSIGLNMARLFAWETDRVKVMALKLPFAFSSAISLSIFQHWKKNSLVGLSSIITRHDSFMLCCMRQLVE